MTEMAKRSAQGGKTKSVNPATGVITTQYTAEDSDSDGGGGGGDGEAGVGESIGGGSVGGGGGMYGFGGVQEINYNASIYISAQEMNDALVCPQEKCWGCIHAFRAQRQPGKNPAADHLCDLRSQNEASMSKPELSRLIAQAYEKLVMVPAIRKGEPYMLFTEYHVLRHLLHHERNIESTLSDTFYRTKDMIAKINDSVLMNDGAGCKVDVKNFVAFKDLVKTQLALGAELRKTGRNS